MDKALVAAVVAVCAVWLAKREAFGRPRVTFVPRVRFRGQPPLLVLFPYPVPVLTALEVVPPVVKPGQVYAT